MKIKPLFIAVFVLAGFTGLIHAEDQQNRLAVTIGNPWLGVKYDISRRFSAELRDVIDPDMNIPAVRGYYSFYKGEKLKGFAGLEYGTISFKSDDVSGTGTLMTVLAGSEYKLLPKLALSAEFGYTIIDVKSSDYEVSGPEYVFNLGLNCYIF
ncbi:MAG: porin family protein [Elusimicrobia bacterium]|nr:porin family protein [Elusimicrobiota bacterium]